MDLLRSCSTQRVIWEEGQVGSQELATWFRAAPSALPFPVPHRFGSPVWDLEHPTATDLGFNAIAPRVYYRGRRLNSSRGRSFAGPLECFTLGGTGQPPLARITNGTPLQCVPGPWGLMQGGLCVDTSPAAGGLLTGGTCHPVTFSAGGLLTGGTVPNPALDCSTLSHGPIRAIVLSATPPYNMHVGSTITMNYTAGPWIGVIGSGTNQIALAGVCGSGHWTCSCAPGLLGPFPNMADTAVVPIDFIFTFTDGFDSIQIHFVQP